MTDLFKVGDEVVIRIPPGHGFYPKRYEEQWKGVYKIMKYVSMRGRCSLGDIVHLSDIGAVYTSIVQLAFEPSDIQPDRDWS